MKRAFYLLIVILCACSEKSQRNSDPAPQGPTTGTPPNLSQKGFSNSDPLSSILKDGLYHLSLNLSSAHNGDGLGIYKGSTLVDWGSIAPTLERVSARIVFDNEGILSASFRIDNKEFLATTIPYEYNARENHLRISSFIAISDSSILRVSPAPIDVSSGEWGNPDISSCLEDEFSFVSEDHYPENLRIVGGISIPYLGGSLDRSPSRKSQALYLDNDLIVEIGRIDNDRSFRFATPRIGLLPRVFDASECVSAPIFFMGSPVFSNGVSF